LTPFKKFSKKLKKKLDSVSGGLYDMSSKIVLGKKAHLKNRADNLTFTCTKAILLNTKSRQSQIKNAGFWFFLKNLF